MSTLTVLMRVHGKHRAARTSSPAVVLLAVVVAVLTGTAPASAYWTATGSTSATAATGTLASPVAVTVPETATTSVQVGWTPGSGGVGPTGYYVTRHTGDTIAAACASSPTALIEGASSCIDTAVPDGEYSYLVTAVYRSWTASSSPSGSVTVVAPLFLGAAQGYSVLAGTAVTSDGTATVSGDVGVSPGTTVTGFDSSTVGGDIHVGDTDAAHAQTAFDVAYTELAESTAVELASSELGGVTLAPGVYHSTAALGLTGTLTLDADNNPDALFIFQTGAAFNTAADSVVTLVGGARASRVFWVVGGAAGTGANSFLSGSILARGAITLGASTQLIGRALSRAAVTLSANTIRFTNALPPTMTIDGGATAVTKDTTPTFTGTSDAPASSRVTVTIAGQTLSATVGRDGRWSVTSTALAAGPYGLVAKVRDPSGNGTAAFQNLTVEVNPALVPLGTADTYSVLAGSGVVNTGTTHLSGDLGVSSSSSSITGFPPGALDGAIHADDPAAAEAQDDLLAALADASSRTLHAEITGDLGGRTFHVGVRHSTAALALTGTVTLDGENDPDAVFIFQTDAAFDTAADSTVHLINGAKASNVFWVVVGTAGTGANSSLSGTILAHGAITLGAGTVLIGQALSRGTVTLAGNTLTGTSPAPAARLAPSSTPSTGPTGAPTVETTPAPSPQATITPTVPDASPQPSDHEPDPTGSDTGPDGTATP